MNKLYIFLALCLFSVFAAQDQTVIHESYPAGQDFYDGGKELLFQDITKTLTDYKLTGCGDAEQTYTASVLVRGNGSAVFVKDFDSANISKNRCAYDLFRKVFPYLKGWKPATVDGKSASAIAQIHFVPAILYKEKIYGSNELTQFPEFPGGVAAFHRAFSKNFNKKAVSSQDSRLVQINITFILNEVGGMEDITVSGDQMWDMAVEAVTAMKKIKTPWKPAQVNGKAVKTRMGLPISMKFK